MQKPEDTLQDLDSKSGTTDTAIESPKSTEKTESEKLVESALNETSKPKELAPPRPRRKPKAKITAEEKAIIRQKEMDEKLKQLKLKRNRLATAINKREKALKNAQAVEKAASPDSKAKIALMDQFKDVQETLRESIVENAIFIPNPGPQTEFLAASEREVLYGGAAGGGKSYAILVDAIRDAGHPEHNAVILRRTRDELRELIQKSHTLYPKAYPGAVFKSEPSTWFFPSGAKVWFTFCDDDKDLLRFQGQQFSYVGFDELTQWPTPTAWDYLRSRLRTTAGDGPNGLRIYMRASTNPGGPGAWWVRKMFISPSTPGKAFWATDLETGDILQFPVGHRFEGQPLFKRRFIPARLSDNPYLYNSGDYEANLLSLPEHLRRQLLEGDWDVIEGAAFPEFRRSVHTCEPFPIPENWLKFRACDWGYKEPACCLWIAADFDNNLYVYRELYVRMKNYVEFSELLIEAEKGESVQYGVLDGSTWSDRGMTGPSIAENINKILRQNGLVPFRKADQGPRSRENGKMEVHQRLAVGPDIEYIEEGEEKVIQGTPSLKIFTTCLNLIRTLPLLPVAKHNVEDVNTDAEDHGYDALRYGVMSRPRPSSQVLFLDKHNPTRPSYQPPADAVFGY